MRPCIVAQAASGPHETLLRLCEAWHRSYCQRHGFDYRAFYGRVQYERPAMWDKVQILLTILRGCAPGSLVIWMDADTIIEQPQESIAAALPDGADVGMARSLVGELNAGVIWIVASAETIRWLERVEQLGPVDGGRYHEQTRLNREFAGLTVAEIEPRFNAYRWVAAQIVEPAVVRAWHAHPMNFRFHMMRRSLSNLLQHYPISA